MAKHVDKKNPKLAMLLSIIPGLGQFYNGQAIKGICFLVLGFLALYQMIHTGYDALVGFYTLGSVPGEDNSLFLLVEGSLQILLIIVYLVVWGFIIRDARNTSRAINEGEKINTTFKEHYKAVVDKGFAYWLVVPAYLFMLIAIVFPVFVTIATAFINYDFKNMPHSKILEWVGFENFKKIFMLANYRKAFKAVFSWTIIWTLAATTLQIVIGIFTAVIMHQPFIRGKRIFGVIFLLPWAVPAFITIMTFSNMFNPSIGAINTQVIPFLNKIIPFLNISSIPWKTNVFWTKVAIILIQGWLGFPYIYVMTTSILQSIPEDLYEAADMDGATGWQKFRYITMPSILRVAAPVFLTQYTGNFNNFSMIYLFNNGGPGNVGGGAGSTDILISWIYKLTTGTSPQYSVAAALAIIISVIIIGVSLIYIKTTDAFNLDEEA